MKNQIESFRKRLIAGDPIVGTFLKTPSPIIAEVLGHTSLDVFCIDKEHAPFGRLETDQCIAAFRSAGRPCLVRTADDSPTEIRNALDSGASGILVPHVTSVSQAKAIAKAAHFGNEGRGYAGSPRAADYTTKSMIDHLETSRDQTTVIVQIEDIAALPHVEDIAAVEGVDGIFIGRVDLAVAMQCEVSDAMVVEAVREICVHGNSAGAAVGMFTPNIDEITEWRDLGASWFLLSSDQSMMLAGARALIQSIR